MPEKKQEQKESFITSLLRNKGFIQFMKRTLAFLFVFFIEALVITTLVDYSFTKPDIPTELHIAFKMPLVFLIAALTFYVISRHRLLKLSKLKLFDYKRLWILLGINIVFFLSFLKLNLFMSKNPETVLTYKLLFAASWYLLAILMGLSLFFAFFRADYVLHFIKNFKKELTLSIIIAIAFRFTYNLLTFTWKFFSKIVSKIVYHMLSLFYSDAAFAITSDAYTPILSAGGFKVQIAAVCAGIEGMTLFLTLFLIVILIDWRFIDKTKAFFLLIIGTLGAFALNILRVFLIFVLGIEFSAEFALGFFHSNVGWILFSLYFVIFEFFTYKWMRKKTIKPLRWIKL